MKRIWLVFPIAATLLLAQQASQDKDKGKDQKKEQKEDSGGLFKNKLGYSSSKQSKESTTLGFNGIDPSGKVGNSLMAKSPGSNDATLVAKMTDNRPSEADLKAFIKEGGLN